MNSTSRPRVKIVRTLALVLGLSLFSCSLSIAQYAGSNPPPSDWAIGFDSIQEVNSERLLKVLTSKGFDGRGTGQEGFIRAAHFVAGKLAEFGFQPIGDAGTYFQNMPFQRTSPDLEASSISLGENLTIRGKRNLGFRQARQTRMVTGKTLIISGNGQGARITDRTALRDRILIVVAEGATSGSRNPFARYGPAATIFVSDSPRSDSRVTRVTSKSAPSGGGSVTAEITPESMQKLLDAMGAKDVNNKANGYVLTPNDTELTIDLKVATQPIGVPNVVGWYEGSDPSLSHEYIVIGAHLDHLGMNSNGLFPGADDNGSGSTALLQLAEAIHLNPIKPKRSVLYIAFAAEEIGLLGSKFYCENPIKPLKDAICMLNIDMIGRNEESNSEPASENEDSIHLLGSKRHSSQLHELVEQANKFVGFRFEYDEEQVYGRSDHHSFAVKEVPVTFLFGGFNPFYHKTTDTLSGINYSKIANAARLNYVLTYLAAEHGHFKHDVKKDKK